MRRMTSNAAFSLNRRMFVDEWSLLVCVTLDASRIGSRRESRLFEFETAVRIVAVAALHRAFQHLVMEGQVELMFGFAVTAQAKLWLALAEQLQIREAGLLCICFGNEYVGGGELSSRWGRMG